MFVYFFMGQRPPQHSYITENNIFSRNNLNEVVSDGVINNLLKVAISTITRLAMDLDLQK